MQKYRTLLPLLLVELYLIITIWLVFYGPVNWNITNAPTLIGFIAFYHIAFILGYIVQLRYGRNNQNKAKPNFSKLANKYYWTILTLAFLGCLISFKNITMSNSFDVFRVIDLIKLGFIDPAQARNLYAEKLYSGDYVGNKYLTALMVFFGVFKYALLPILVFNWRKLNFCKRLFGILVLIIPILSGVAMSLSSINFFYLFTILVSLLVIFMSNDYEDGGIKGILRRKGVLFSLLVIFFFSFWQFYAVKSGASLYNVVVHGARTASFDYMTANGIEFKRKDDSSVLYDFYEKLTVYIVQGYKGMSISLNESWDSTYGLGHSVFLQRVFEDYLGFDIRERTYQRKITEIWDENIYWHSAYSYFANDVSFYGVIVVMFFIGYFFSSTVTSALFYNNFIAKILLPLFALMFFYLPANNQVFSFLENMISFWVLTFVYMYSLRKKSQINSCEEFNYK
ncbi:hypothetical protein [Salinivibrio proteolyticus]|uniref:Oligosaccharide repeat unit polymerase n=1 Tax=Salinivibrio proteolyticus TaxID=334715 RepID=A0ABY7LCM4_9GAMM|nr:hypothetical protein [Salinivibrio proteolyticus]WBA13976.1 hypothetical protein N7E60_09580 [Salinivibrio proteolyticus]